MKPNKPEEPQLTAARLGRLDEDPGQRKPRWTAAVTAADNQGHLNSARNGSHLRRDSNGADLQPCPQGEVTAMVTRDSGTADTAGTVNPRRSGGQQAATAARKRGPRPRRRAGVEGPRQQPEKRKELAARTAQRRRDGDEKLDQGGFRRKP